MLSLLSIPNRSGIIESNSSPLFHKSQVFVLTDTSQVTKRDDLTAVRMLFFLLDHRLLVLSKTLLGKNDVDRPSYISNEYDDWYGSPVMFVNVCE